MTEFQLSNLRLLASGFNSLSVTRFTALATATVVDREIRSVTVDGVLDSVYVDIAAVVPENYLDLLRWILLLSLPFDIIFDLALRNFTILRVN